VKYNRHCRALPGNPSIKSVLQSMMDARVKPAHDDIVSPNYDA